MNPDNVNLQRPGDEPREAAMMIVAAWLRDGAFPDRLLERVSGRGHAAVQELVYGAIKWQRLLDWRIERVVKRSPRRDVAALLLTAACELFQMRDSPPHAVVHDCVAIARRRLTRAEAAFVNAVLRSMLRDRPAADAALEQAPPAVRWSHPDVLWRRWTDRLGVSATEALAAWNNGRADVTIRPRPSSGGMAVWMPRWQVAGIAVTPHPARPAECLRVPRGISVSDIPGYAEGAFSVQDPSTLAAVDLLAPMPHEVVLDACAAPGGKTGVIADCLNGTGRLVALDANARRLRRLRQNLERFQQSGVEVGCCDLTDPTGVETVREMAPQGFDAILLDVPCSNTGVMRRRPDVRWRFDETALQSLTALQSALLSAAAGCLGPAGRIVYSTCSLEDEENAALIARWLSEHPDFRLDRDIRLIPPHNDADGAYAARLVRRPSA